MVWEEEEVETTWQEVSTFYKHGLKSISCSQYDYAERGPVCYAKTDPETEETPPGLDFAPLIFQSLYYVQTRKGFNVQEIIFSRLFTCSLLRVALFVSNIRYNDGASDYFKVEIVRN